MKNHRMPTLRSAGPAAILNLLVGYERRKVWHFRTGLNGACTRETTMADGAMLFDTAIATFYAATSDPDQSDFNHLLTGLQQFAYAVQTAAGATNSLDFPNALANFETARTQSDHQQLVTAALALQQFCYATRQVFYPNN